jgi:hypothetical protein
MITNDYYDFFGGRLEIAASSGWQCCTVIGSAVVRARYPVPAAMWLSGRDCDSLHPAPLRPARSYGAGTTSNSPGADITA